MRLYAIAEEAISRGIESVFIGNYLEVSWLSEMIHNLGFSAINPELDSYLEDKNDAILILDSYSIAPDDEFISDGNWGCIVAIVDKETPAYKCDVAIHPGLSATWDHSHFNNFYYGPNLVPVRQEILKLKKNLKNDSKKVKKILVLGGGTDPFNFGLSVAHKLALIEGDIEFVFFTKKEDEIVKIDSRFKCKKIGAELVTELDSADLIISPASTSSLEFLALNKIIATCALVDNQSELYRFFQGNNLAQCLGILRDENSDYISLDSLREIIEFEPRRKLISKNIDSLIDGFGAKRIIDLLLEKNLSEEKSGL
jgi:spore coat polysaccharide biosynthesis predicted glycosyltransferase SpsG